ncbi:MAG TPA: transglycosylase domain-containing protein [Acidimicrobiia bacterium]
MAGGVGVGLLTAGLVPGLTHLAAGSHYTGKVAPQIEPLDRPSTMYDSQGHPMSTLALHDRELATLREVPKVAVNAVVATEDRTFFTNAGIDASSMARALISNVNSGEIAQGGSTITQQLVKNRYFRTPARSLDRKLKEAAIAVRLTNEWSKDKILEEYLNTVYFGEGSYGIKAAARRYFGVPLEQLNLAQAAMLAGVIRDPNGNDPFKFPERALKRRAAVLDKMVQQHYITNTQAKIADIFPLPSVRPPDLPGPNDFYSVEVKDELLNNAKYGLGRTYTARYNNLFSGGLTIDTGFDPHMQLLANQAVQNILPQGTQFTAAMTVMDPTSGQVRAVVSGPGYQVSQQKLYSNPPDANGQGGRRPGSTFKAIDLATAIESGYSPDDVVDGTSPCQLNPVGVKPVDAAQLHTANAEPGGGEMTLRAATQNSVNCAFFRMGYALFPFKIINMAERLGLNPNRKPQWTPSDLIGSGNLGVSPLDLATIYSTIADDGVRHDPSFVTKVTDRYGHVLYQAPTAGTRAIAPQVARTVTNMLQAVIVGGTGTRAQLRGRPAAGKTGTVDNETDAWFVGYTPQLLAAVWMGNPASDNPDNALAQMKGVGPFSEVFGGTFPAEIWQAFMSAALADQPALSFIPPDPSLWPTPRMVDENGREGPVIVAPPPTAAPAPAPAPNAATPPPARRRRRAPATTVPPTSTPPPTGQQGGHGGGQGGGG